jgi:hypothetical protein
MLVPFERGDARAATLSMSSLDGAIVSHCFPQVNYLGAQFTRRKHELMQDVSNAIA